jgi:hypothetical protein
VAAGEEPELQDYAEVFGDGQQLSLGSIQKLRAAIVKLKATFPSKPNDKDGNAFEAKAAEIVHRNFPSVDPAVKSDPGFWRYLCLSHFREIIEWRYGKADKDAHRNHYGIGNTKRNFLWKLYYRADVSFDASNEKDPYVLSRIQDKDLWESHILAVRPGSVRVYVRAFLRFLYPKVLGKPTIDTPTLRKLASRLNRLRANIYFECYASEKSIMAIIESEVQKAKDEATIAKSMKMEKKKVKLSSVSAGEPLHA